MPSNFPRVVIIFFYNPDFEELLSPKYVILKITPSCTEIPSYLQNNFLSQDGFLPLFLELESYWEHVEIAGIERLQRSFTAKRIKLTVIFLSYNMTRPSKTFLMYCSKSYWIFFLHLHCF